MRLVKLPAGGADTRSVSTTSHCLDDRFKHHKPTLDFIHPERFTVISNG